MTQLPEETALLPEETALVPEETALVPEETALLPEEFADLEPFAERWALETEAERYAERLTSSMDDMQDLYDTTMPRMEAALSYLDTLELEALPGEARALMRLLFSTVNISFPVEVWKQPNVPDSGAAYLDLHDDPVV